MPFDGATGLSPAAPPGRLGNHRLIVEPAAQTPPHNRRRSRTEQLKYAVSRLVPDNPAATCCDYVVGNRAGVHLKFNGTKAKWSGLAHCQRGAFCPICMPAIQKVRREKIQLATKSAKDRALQLVFITFTIQHSHRETLAAVEGRLSRSWRKMIQRSFWRKFKRIGYIKIIETPYSRANSWHPHYHLIMFIEAKDEAAAIKHCASLREHWKDAVEAVGGSVNEHGFDVRSGADAEAYLTKIDETHEAGFDLDSGESVDQRIKKIDKNLAFEMTDTGGKTAKSGRHKLLTPMQLLAQFADTGDGNAAHRFREFVEWSKGKRLIDWSKGLADLLGIKDASPNDDEIKIDGDEQPEFETVAIVRPTIWRNVVRAKARARVLEVCEHHGPDAAIAFIKSLPTVKGPLERKPKKPRPKGRGGSHKAAGGLAPGGACGARTI